MFSRFLTNCPIGFVSSIKESLKILEIQTPTTKPIIKKQYLQMAKKYHPDLSADKQKLTEKQLQERFVNISKAYSYLREFSEEDINNFRQNSQYMKADSQQRKQKNRKMTTQQKMRQQSYEYFNQEYSKFKNSGYESSPAPNNFSIFKGAPQLLAGVCFLMMIMGDWVYKSHKKSKEKEKNKNKGESRNYDDVFKSMNMHNKYGANVKKVVEPGLIQRAQIKD